MPGKERRILRVIKYIIYFLLSCDTKQTISFFYKYKTPWEENKSFPKRFIRYSKSFFIKNKHLPSPLEKDFFLAWRVFCHTHSYEEVLPIILYGILKYPEEKILWLLKLPPETLSWRLHQGLLALEKECINMEKEKNKPLPSGNDELPSSVLLPEGNKAITYCDWLSQQALPSEVNNIATDSKSKKKKYLLFVLLCFILIVIIVGFKIFVLSFPSRTILYRSGQEIIPLRVVFPLKKKFIETTKSKLAL